MAGSKRYTRRYGSKSMRFKKNNSKTNYNLDKKITNVNKKVKKLQNEIETKSFTLAQSPILVDDTYLQAQCCNMGGGTGNGQRIGNRIRTTSITIRGGLDLDGATDGPAKFRLILFWDKQPNGAYPPTTSTEGLLAVASGGKIVNAPYNIRTIHQRYEVIYDRTFVANPRVIDNTGAAANYAPVKTHFHIHKKLSKQIYYNAGGTAITDIEKNNLVFLAVGSDSTPNIFFMEYTMQLNYKDA